MKDHTDLYKKYRFKCLGCDTRHPDNKKKCFVCGQTDTIVLDRVKKVKKKKSSIRGATISLKV